MQSIMDYFAIAALVPVVAIVACLKHYIPWLISLPDRVDELPELAGLVVSLPGFPFWCLFIFRYLRLIVHIISFWCFYRPTPIPAQPTLFPKDCSVILPTIDPENADFKECIQSCLVNQPGEIIIVTVGRNMAALTNQIVGPFRGGFPHTNIQVHFTDVANKRIQVAHGVSFATGKVTILLDDHVFWKSHNFLPTVLAPFEDDKVGAVSTNKRVRRTDTGFNICSFWNMIGALYLERHNFEIRATNAIDGGVFVISGRTASYRTSILKQPGFMAAFTNERFFFGLFGPLNADDDNFLTRQVVAQGYDIKIQYNSDALIETTLGTYPKFLSQCLRWVRTTWRSNSASLFTDGTVWTRQPWCIYAVYLTSFVNFALFYDAALIYTLSKFADRSMVYVLLGWIFASKMVKLTPYFLREPQDLLMLPGYFIFAYFHSLIKLYAGLTFWVTAWGGRNLDAINRGGDSDSDNDDDGDSRAPSPLRLSSGSLTSRPASSSSSGGSDSDGHSALSGQTAIPGTVVPTLWGNVRDYHNSPVRPANVLECQFMKRSPTPKATTSSPSISRVQTPSPYRLPNSQLPTPSPSISSFHLPSPCRLPTTQLPTPSPSVSSFHLHSPCRTTTDIYTSNPSKSYTKPSYSTTITNLKPTPSTHPFTTTNPFTLARERCGLGIPDTYAKSWTRGKQCQCLHSDRDMLFKTRSCRCLVEDVFEVGQVVVPGRPRF